MRYRDLKVYTGPKTGCDQCKRAFATGQVIHVNDKYGLVFCDSDSDGPTLCLQSYLVFQFLKTNPGESLSGELRVFGQHNQIVIVPGNHSLLRRLKQAFGVR